MIGGVMDRKRIAVIGSGVAGLSAAWLSSHAHDVTLYEAEPRAGGHCDTAEIVRADGSRVAVDTGFIVFNETTYPNFSALLHHVGARSEPSDMSFAVSLDDGALEYSGDGLSTLFAQKRNLVNPRFWRMLGGLARFYLRAPRDLAGLRDETLAAYLDRLGIGEAFREDHLYPMTAAVWSAPASRAGDYPARAYVRFCENHGLLKFRGRPQWRTLAHRSRDYVDRLVGAIGPGARIGVAATRVTREADGATVRDATGGERRFDAVVLGTHADRAFSLLGDPDPREREILGAFRYSRNVAWLHADPAFMPRDRRVWASWNYVGPRGDDAGPCVTYWMNRLQNLAGPDVFVTLNPPRPPDPSTVWRRRVYEHPIFDSAALAAQERLWELQGSRATWFCGAHFGAGFHEDGLQAGLAVAEAIGGVRRPWSVEAESARIVLGPRGAWAARPAEAFA
ncbi:MAG: NAD(P)-binding protein [Hyphomicrobiales bacterium]|nr:NAD(P)-binding protein [Hyphomicrobiales bacterium]MDE2016185.1 NAD(P)-binding protein [Hyphomicrobiales bacterium]